MVFPYLSASSNLQAFQTGGKRDEKGVQKVQKPSPEAAAKAKAKAAAKAKAEKKEASHKMAIKMGYIIMIHHDPALTPFQTKRCILMRIFKGGIQTIRFIMI